mmetsp:Transcript_56605/g.106214  ORF Transcript_56605/g.106214 Transcript_56605/m.106214 type:complete len:118 (+) Transcript_56605:54-407(+)
MALALAEQAGVEPQLAMKLGPFSCFCLCVERGTIDAGAALLLAQAGVQGEAEGTRHGGPDSADLDDQAFNDYDYYPPVPFQEDEREDDREQMPLLSEDDPPSAPADRKDRPPSPTRS